MLEKQVGVEGMEKGRRVGLIGRARVCLFGSCWSVHRKASRLAAIYCLMFSMSNVPLAWSWCRSWSYVSVGVCAVVCVRAWGQAGASKSRRVRKERRSEKQAWVQGRQTGTEDRGQRRCKRKRESEAPGATRRNGQRRKRASAGASWRRATALRLAGSRLADSYGVCDSDSEWLLIAIVVCVYALCVYVCIVYCVLYSVSVHVS